MKKSFLIVIMAFSTVLAAGAQGRTINQGEYVTFLFTNLDFYSANTNLFSVARAGVGFEAPDLAANESVQMDFFTDSSLQGVPFFTQAITVPPGPIFYGSVAFETPSTAWDDLDGGVRVTMLSGSASIVGVFFDVNRPGERYFSVQLIPEPGAWALLAPSIVLLFLVRGGKRRLELVQGIHRTLPRNEPV